MEWFIAVLAVATLGVAAMAAAGGVGQMSEEPVHDIFRATLPDRPLTASDLKDTRFGLALRGYAMDQVDDLLDRLGREIDARDARISDLLGTPPTGRVPPHPEPFPAHAEPVEGPNTALEAVTGSERVELPPSADHAIPETESQARAARP